MVKLFIITAGTGSCCFWITHRNKEKSNCLTKGASPRSLVVNRDEIHEDITICFNRSDYCYNIILHTFLNTFLKPRHSVYKTRKSPSDGVLPEV